MRLSLAGGVIYGKKRAVTDDDGIHRQNQLIDRSTELTAVRNQRLSVRFGKTSG
jgi:hypothetical protein